MGKGNEETWAAAAVCAAIGASSEPFDQGGRQRAVDFLLRLSSGGEGALEVTSHAEPGSREVGALLARARFVWPSPGRWAWSIAFDAQASVKEIQRIYTHVIATCERFGAVTPDALPFPVLMDDEILWAAAHEELHARFRGYPEDGRNVAQVNLLPGAVAGGVDERLVHLPEVVTSLLSVPHVDEHVAKLVAHSADEHHLFIAIGPGGIPFPQFYPLCGVPDTLPDGDPEVSRGVSHLWLATGFGPTLLGWTRREGWQSHHVSKANSD